MVVCCCSNSRSRLAAVPPQAWKEHLYPLLKQHLADHVDSSISYLVLYHEAAVANLLEVSTRAPRGDTTAACHPQTLVGILRGSPLLLATKCHRVPQHAMLRGCSGQGALGVVGVSFVLVYL
jgi:hypothetical protein